MIAARLNSSKTKIMKNCGRSSFPIISPSSASAIAQKPSTDLVQEMRCVQGNDGRLIFSALSPKREGHHDGEELEAVNSVQRLNVAVQHHHAADAESEEADEDNGVGADVRVPVQEVRGRQRSTAILPTRSLVRTKDFITAPDWTTKAYRSSHARKKALPTSTRSVKRNDVQFRST